MVPGARRLNLIEPSNGAKQDFRIGELEARARDRDREWDRLMQEVIPGINTKIAINTLKVSLLTALATALLTVLIQRYLP